MAYRSKGGTASPQPALSKGSLASLSALLCRPKAVLGLTELGQVEGGDLLGLLDLLLVGLHLALHLVDEGLHPERTNMIDPSISRKGLVPLVVFLVLIGSKGELLDLPLGLPQVLLGISKPDQVTKYNMRSSFRSTS